MDYRNYHPTTASDIVRIRRRIEEANIPPKHTDHNLLVATWNLRAFSRVFDSHDENPRSPKRNLRAIAIIAEIISRFDVIAIQEIKRDLDALRTLLAFLGPDWDFIVSDVTEGDPGNVERLGFVYDRRRVEPSGLAGELVLPPGPGDTPPEQFARTPYAVSFRSRREEFILATLHVLWGETDQPELRIPELQAIADWMAEWSDRTRFHQDLLVLGDFNINRRGDPLFDVFTSRGLNVPQAIHGISTNLATGRDARHYDQIAWFTDQLQMVHTGRGGTVDFAGAVFQGLTRRSMSFRVSDHLPLWVEFSIDRSQSELIDVLGLDETQPDPFAEILD